MAVAAHRASHWCTSRNSRRLPEGGRDRGATTGCLGTASAGKTGQRGDHRLFWVKTGQRGDPRLYCGFFTKPAIRQCLRSPTANSSSRDWAWPEWHGYLARPGFRSRLSGGYETVKRFVRKLRGPQVPGSSRNHPHCGRRRSTSRLRFRSDGAGSAERQVSPDATVRDDSRLQPQIAFACWSGVRVYASGPSCMSKPFVV